MVCTLTALTDLSLKGNELTVLTPLVGNLVELRTLDIRLMMVGSYFIFSFKQTMLVNIDLNIIVAKQ